MSFSAYMSMKYHLIRQKMFAEAISIPLVLTLVILESWEGLGIRMLTDGRHNTLSQKERTLVAVGLLLVIIVQFITSCLFLYILNDKIRKIYLEVERLSVRKSQIALRKLPWTQKSSKAMISSSAVIGPIKVDEKDQKSFSSKLETSRDGDSY
eukprot:CAMPEP_0167765400 /NCGR_PEP_ID=MMETSP0110_2-20121227/14661_1 /TAXON_ID=629695 /ORGANISM="Gymnochlora sp., Strain CCMP2014" /LENGTH=152 /DNA_ID=CAMNT_0007653099 /DNA_START=609 /DNA_END=1064 /DNA_ORIENTATION=+